MLLAARWEVRIGKNCVSRPITCLSFFSCGKLAYKWVCLGKFVIELAYATFTNHSQKYLTSEKARNSDARQRKMFVAWHENLFYRKYSLEKKKTRLITNVKRPRAPMLCRIEIRIKSTLNLKADSGRYPKEVNLILS